MGGDPLVDAGDRRGRRDDVAERVVVEWPAAEAQKESPLLWSPGQLRPDPALVVIEVLRRHLGQRHEATFAALAKHDAQDPLGQVHVSERERHQLRAADAARKAGPSRGRMNDT